MGMDLVNTRRRWDGVNAQGVSHVIHACSAALGKVLRTEHGPFGDVYAEFETHGPCEGRDPAPEVVTTVYTVTALDGTKGLTIVASYEDPATLDFLEPLFDAVTELMEAGARL